MTAGNSLWSKNVVEMACSVGTVFGFYLTLWLANLHDPSARWMLLVCLFAVWLSFVIGRSVANRIAKRRDAGQGEAGAVERGISPIVWGFVGMNVLMLSLGLLLRFTA